MNEIGLCSPDIELDGIHACEALAVRWSHQMRLDNSRTSISSYFFLE